MRKKILITGSSGFVGKNLIPFLEKNQENEIITTNSSEYNLLDISQTQMMIDNIRPSIVIHLAALSGGIGANKSKPADFYFINTILLANMFEVCSKSNVEKIIYTMGGCSYPASATSPINESQLWSGFPQKESAAYSTSKMMSTVASTAYFEQYGLKSSILIPGNLYGPHDNYSLENSHVIPAVIRKIFEAKSENRDSITFWGTGSPLRDFVYIEDVVKTFPYFISNDNPGPINISSGSTTSIKDLVGTICEIFEYEGEVIWDTSKSDGQKIKIFDTKKLNELGLYCSTPLKEGLKKTIDWYKLNYKIKGNIRL